MLLLSKSLKDSFKKNPFHGVSHYKGFAFAFFSQKLASKSVVTPYEEKHYSAVKKLAMDNLQRLVTTKPGAHDEDFTNSVKPLFKEQNCLVSHVEDTAVAFLTHGNPYKGFSTLGKTFVKIEQLASDQTLKGNGYGSDLLKFALKKLEKEGAQFAVLQVNDRSLVSYYAKFGFKVTGNYSTRNNTVMELGVKLGPPAKNFTERAVNGTVMRVEGNVRVIRVLLPQLLAAFSVALFLYLLPDSPAPNAAKTDTRQGSDL